MLFFRYCFCRLGLSLGLKNTKNKKASHNPVLEKAFKTYGKLNHKDIINLTKQTDYTERQIERWLRLRRMQGKPSNLHKFSESWYVTNILLIVYKKFYYTKNIFSYEMFYLHCYLIKKK